MLGHKHIFTELRDTPLRYSDKKDKYFECEECKMILKEEIITSYTIDLRPIYFKKIIVLKKSNLVKNL